jgi:hypothetical protein
MDLNELQNFYHVRNASNKPCFVVNITAEHGIWQSENPLTQSLPLLAMLLAATIFVTRAVYYLLRPLAVPRIVTDFLVSNTHTHTHTALITNATLSSSILNFQTVSMHEH